MSNGKALGVAMSSPTLEDVTADSLTVTNATISNDLTMGDAGNIILNTGTGTQIGTASIQKLATYGKAPVEQTSAIPAVTGAVSLTTTMNAMLTVIRNFGLIA